MEIRERLGFAPKQMVILLCENGILIRIAAPADLPNRCVHNKTGVEFYLTNLEDTRGEVVYPVYMETPKRDLPPLELEKE